MTADNTSARDDILNKVRNALGRGGMDATLRADLETRVSEPKPNLIPARPGATHEDHVAVYVAEAERVNVDLVRVKSFADVPQAVARYLAEKNLPTTVKVSDNDTLGAIPWEETSLLSVSKGKADGDDPVGVALAFAGIAETGTLLMHSSAKDATLTNFLPDTHIAVLPAARIHPTYESAWGALRTHQDDPGTMPRMVNLITGPSRTADIEQTLLLGAHGPRQQLVVLVEDDA